MSADMSFLAMFGLVCCILGALALALYSFLFSRKENKRLQQLEKTALYLDLKAQIAALQRLDLDAIRIECSGVTILSVCPAHLVLDFSFKQNGNSLRNTGLTRLYAELIARDFPFLTHPRAYQLHRYTVYRPNGRKEQAYAFLMRRGYKDYLLAARSTASLAGPTRLRIY